MHDPLHKSVVTIALHITCVFLQSVPVQLDSKVISHSPAQANTVFFLSFFFLLFTWESGRAKEITRCCTGALRDMKPQGQSRKQYDLLLQIWEKRIHK